MRPRRYWTPRYLYDRGREKVYWRLNPTAPYLNRQVVDFLDTTLQEDDTGLEWGSGNSTIWFANRCGELITVEHDPSWAEWVTNQLEQRRLKEKVVVHLCRASPAAGAPPSYVSVGRELNDASLDFVLVDGKNRDACALVALTKLKPGGFLIIDDAHRYIPRDHPSSAPFARGPDDGFVSAMWAEFGEVTLKWRCYWRSDGVSDTALWIKPA